MKHFREREREKERLRIEEGVSHCNLMNHGRRNMSLCICDPDKPLITKHLRGKG